MKKNIHPVERVFRVVLGAAITSLAFFGSQSNWFLLGVIPVMTGIIGWCPPYAILGINTCKINNQ